MTLKIIPILILMSFCKLSAWSQNSVRDTVFILKETADGLSHTIYIDRYPSSTHYSKISDFTIGHADTAHYQSSLAYLKEKNPEPFKHYKMADLNKQWCSLHAYKNKYYLYAPCDDMFNYKVSITDTTYIDYFGDGPSASMIHSFSILNPLTYQLGLTTYDNIERHITIHIIDRQTGVAVFEESTKNGSPNYYLMVMANHTSNFPIIINDCKSQKLPEFNGFDNLNIAKLLKAK